ncbi:MAG TPA: DUF1702 family protein [Actinophytocola sp.]|uniref:DUF1702 family protein n=1 Tax=Actinophytocola sp. TaxID=1872138 RepID=UPI002E075CEA|nr:DUF1702 family protein [Actinophytocola sp.]
MGFRLPLGMADFAKRGFRLDRPDERAVLERHARSFLAGFNEVTGWRNTHGVLGQIPDEERGFAYEGAGMRAALHDLVAPARAAVLPRLLAGPGQRYVHLIHVGYGWGLVPTRLPVPVRLPATPLLRWLALDGAGFAEVFFGGLPALRRRCGRPATPRQAVRIAGCGRALWFLQCADVAGVAGIIDTVPAEAKPQLWAGAGLAACYAGGIDRAKIDELVAASGKHEPHLRQGALFAITARARSGVVPAHTEMACRQLFSVGPDVAEGWTDDAARGLAGSAELSSYMEWKSRLRIAVAHRS